jgi:lipopolysaccharide export system permease protein
MFSILQRYVSKSYLSSWLLAMLVLTFVLSIGLLVKATQLVVKGLPAELVLNFLAVGIPESLSFTIPLASLVSALLLFGRLSADGEISAMRSCGVNLWSVMFPLILFGVALTALSIYVNAEVAPKGTAKRHDLINGSTKTKDLVKILEPGRFIRDFNGVDLWFESREGDILKNLLILEKMPSGSTRETRCEEAFLYIGDGDMMLDMRNVRITPLSENQPGTATARQLRHTIKNVVKKRTLRRKVGDLGNIEIRERLQVLATSDEAASPLDVLTDDEKRSAVYNAARVSDKDESDVTKDEAEAAAKLLIPQITSTLKTEYNRRLALGLAPLAFILLGMPLGIRTSRRESNLGIAISLGVMLLYYAFMIAAKSLAKYPEIYPHVIIWTPTVICGMIAAFLVRKNQ